MFYETKKNNNGLPNDPFKLLISQSIDWSSDREVGECTTREYAIVDSQCSPEIFIKSI